MDVATETARMPTRRSSRNYDNGMSPHRGAAPVSSSTNRGPTTAPAATGGGRPKRRLAPRRSLRMNPDVVSLALEPPPSKQQRRSARGSSSLWDLARIIHQGKNVVFITGAGLSVASGIRAFRTTNHNTPGYSTGMTRTTHRTLSGRKKTDTAYYKRKGSSGSGKAGMNKTSGLIEEQPLGIWNSVLWTQAKRETFRKDPLVWWNDFWLKFFPPEDYENKYRPNKGHLTLAALQRHFPTSINIITQNVDGLQHMALEIEEVDKVRLGVLKKNIIEAHGRLGLYKCIPNEDSDTDFSTDEDDDRPVHLGHRRKYRARKQKHQLIIEPTTRDSACRDPPGKGEERSTRIRRTQPRARKMDPPARNARDDVPALPLSSHISRGRSTRSCAYSCKYQMVASLSAEKLVPVCVREVLQPTKNGATANRSEENASVVAKTHNGRRRLSIAPCCPVCGNKVLPQALLFDEGYHSHDHYNFASLHFLVCVCWCCYRW